MKRLALIAVLLCATLHVEAQQNLGYWTAYALGGIKHFQEKIERGEPIRVLAIGRSDAPVREPQLRYPELTIVDTVQADDPATKLDLAETLAGIYGITPFECIVMFGLKAHEIVRVEQFVRAQTRAGRRILIVATSTGVRSAPLAIVGNRTYARLEALRAYRLLEGTMRERARVIDSTPVQDEHRAWVRCLAPTPREESTITQAGICYRNAIEKKKKEKASDNWEQAIEDLAVAIMLDGVEALDKNVYVRGWGYDRYFPRFELADVLSRLGQCKAVHLELSDPESKATTAMRREIYKRCPPGPSDRTSVLFDPLLGAIPSELRHAARSAHNRTRTVDGISELLPPFAPPLAWSDIALY